MNKRPDISNRVLTGSLLTALLLLALYFLLLPYLPDAFQTPGNPVVYLVGVVGSIFLLVAAVFVWVKRTGARRVTCSLVHCTCRVRDTGFCTCHHP